MKIAVISDTHRDSYYIGKAVDAVIKSGAEVVFHLGDNVADIFEIEDYLDIPIYNVKGNCDFSTSAEDELIITIAEKKFLLCHGHLYNVKVNLNNLIYRAQEAGVDCILYGHTHIAQVLFEEGIWVVNPGSASLPRGGKNSIAIIEISDSKISPSILSI